MLYLLNHSAITLIGGYRNKTGRNGTKFPNLVTIQLPAHWLKVLRGFQPIEGRNTAPTHCQLTGSRPRGDSELGRHSTASSLAQGASRVSTKKFRWKGRNTAPTHCQLTGFRCFEGFNQEIPLEREKYCANSLPAHWLQVYERSNQLRGGTLHHYIFFIFYIFYINCQLTGSRCTSVSTN